MSFALPELLAPELLRRVAILLPVAAVLGAAATGAALLVAGLAARRSGFLGPRAAVRALRCPLLTLGPILGIRVAWPAAELPPAVDAPLDHLLSLALIGCVGWALVGLTRAAQEVMDARFDMEQPDNLLARRVQTRFRLLRRIVVAAIVALTAIAALMTFPSVRTLGAGLLASAGLLGLVVGMAARPSMEALLAGVQVALTQPIRLDDVVIMEGEWGRIEEIRATYVVVRIWDDRRLIVPLQQVLAQPFQNWTRRSAELTGAVTFEVDPRTCVEEVRRAAGEIVARQPDFDGRFWNLVVVEAGATTLRLRVLATAADAGRAWNLRCAIREELLAWLQREHPSWLPRVRIAPVESEAPQTPSTPAS